MAPDWEAWLTAASGPASPTEEQERDRTFARVNAALGASDEIPSSVTVYVKGSYANNTSVRRDADVDIAVEWRNTAKVSTWGKTEVISPAQLGYTPTSEPVTLRIFRSCVERALARALGTPAVDVSPDKHIGVAAASGTLDADVVPCFEMYRYDNVRQYVAGHRIYPKSGGYVDNFPRQNYENGVAKNNATRRGYKEIVRCTKRLVAELHADGVIRRDYPGYLIECLIYNVPNDHFGNTRRYDDMVGVLGFLRWGLARRATYEFWTEPSELLMLFRGRPDRVPENALDVVTRALRRLETR